MEGVHYSTRLYTQITTLDHWFFKSRSFTFSLRSELRNYRKQIQANADKYDLIN